MVDSLLKCFLSWTDRLLYLVGLVLDCGVPGMNTSRDYPLEILPCLQSSQSRLQYSSPFEFCSLGGCSFLKVFLYPLSFTIDSLGLSHVTGPTGDT